MHTHRHIHTPTHTYTHTCIHTHTLAYTHTHFHTHLHKHIHIHTHTHIHTFIYTHTHSQTCMHTNTLACALIHTPLGISEVTSIKSHCLILCTARARRLRENKLTFKDFLQNNITSSSYTSKQPEATDSRALQAIPRQTGGLDSERKGAAFWRGLGCSTAASETVCKALDSGGMSACGHVSAGRLGAESTRWPAQLFPAHVLRLTKRMVPNVISLSGNYYRLVM